MKEPEVTPRRSGGHPAPPRPRCAGPAPHRARGRPASPRGRSASPPAHATPSPRSPRFESAPCGVETVRKSDAVKHLFILLRDGLIMPEAMVGIRPPVSSGPARGFPGSHGPRSACPGKVDGRLRGWPARSASDGHSSPSQQPSHPSPLLSRQQSSGPSNGRPSGPSSKLSRRLSGQPSSELSSQPLSQSPGQPSRHLSSRPSRHLSSGPSGRPASAVSIQPSSWPPTRSSTPPASRPPTHSSRQSSSRSSRQRSGPSSGGTA